MNSFHSKQHESHWTSAWTRDEIERSLNQLLECVSHKLPSPSASILIKPNLNNDLNALTGNSVDLRVLDALIRILKSKGYLNLCVADGPNIGIERRGIDVFERLGVRQLCKHHAINLIDLNADLGLMFSLASGSTPRVARHVLDADFLISVPKIKTHCEALLSCAMKNWVGICVGQDKRQMHHDLGLNIASLNSQVRPDLIIVDGIIGMEGNGPGDGTPVALKQLIVSTSTHLNDLVVAQLLNIPPLDIPYLKHALDREEIDPILIQRIEKEVRPLTNIERPPPRPKLAILSESAWLKPLKLAVRPLTAKPEILDWAYQAGIVQDVYQPIDAKIRKITREPDACGSCTRCAELCPTGVPLEEIGREHNDCISCLQCWWACPTDALQWHGIRGHLHRHILKYRPSIISLFDSIESS